MSYASPQYAPNNSFVGQLLGLPTFGQVLLLKVTPELYPSFVAW